MDRPIERDAFLRLPGIPVPLYSVTFVNPQQGWAVGEGGVIVATSDGGQRWVQQTSSVGDVFYSVTFVNPQQGWAVGHGGVIVATSDGGQRWVTQTSTVGDVLFSVTFVNPQQGWAVGVGGVIVATSDGGQSWVKQTSTVSEGLSSVTFVNPQQGWAVGFGGVIVATSDGGKSWVTQTSTVGDMFNSVTFVNPQQGWAVGFGGVIVATNDGGKSWGVQVSTVSDWLRSADVRKPAAGLGRRLWRRHRGDQRRRKKLGRASQHGQRLAPIRDVRKPAAGLGRRLGRRDRGDQRWRQELGQADQHGQRPARFGNVCEPAAGLGRRRSRRNRGDQRWRPELGPAGQHGQRPARFGNAFVNPRQGWAVGLGGVIVATRDGGKSWVRQTSTVSDRLDSVTFVNPQQGWAVGGRGEIVATSDGGQSWVQQASTVSGGLYSVTFVNPQQGWAVGDVGVIVATSDGGKSWVQQTSTVSAVLNSVTFVNPQQGWAVGEGGVIVSTSDGGKSWVSQTSKVSGGLDAVTFVNPQQGLAVGDGGVIVATSDGGKSWVTQTSTVSGALLSVTFVNPQQGWAVGAGGVIVATSDGGKNWASPLEPYAVYPPPWFYVSVILVLFFGVQSFRRPPPIPESDSIADRLISDNPLSDSDFDALNLRAVAQGLSRFFRNRKTVPPMTVAIIGDWGFGKSSLMRLLEADLRKNRVRPVWFNAWHHQTEEQLLAYLLEGIRKQAIPSTLTPTGLRFRLRLVWSRIGTSWRSILVSALIIGLCGGVICKYGIFTSLSDFIKSFDSLDDFIKVWAGPAATAAGVITGFFGLKELLKPFGVSPAALLRSAEKSARIQALEAKTSFRMAFESQFQDVTAALWPNQMVIFIDDLDRCQPDRILQILEATNFLVSAGECFVVLGIAKKIVLAAVGLAFKKIAQEVTATPQPGTDGAIATRRDYAQNYLSKLINLEVNVRRQNSAQVRLLVTQAGRQQLTTPAERITAWAHRNAFLLLFPFAIGGAYASFRSVQTWLPASEASPKATPSAAPTPIPGPRPTPSAAISQTPAPAPTVAESQEGLRPGAPKNIRDWWYVVFSILAAIPAIALVVSLFRRPDSVVDDSPKFNNALRIWSDFLAEHCSSPREIKRFMSFVRYLAMRTRPPEQRFTPLERLINWIADRLAKAASWLAPRLTRGIDWVTERRDRLTRWVTDRVERRIPRFAAWLARRREPQSDITGGGLATPPISGQVPNGGDDSAGAGDLAKVPDETAILCMAVLTFGPKPVVRDSGPVNYESLKKTESRTLLAALEAHAGAFRRLPTRDEWSWYTDIVGEVSVNDGAPAAAVEGPVITADGATSTKS